MKRTKLTTASSLPPGTLPPTSAWYEVPRCFACDDPIKSHRFSTSLLQGQTQYSHSSIPGKLGEYIGDGFVVVVTSDDALCRNCMNLLNTMDRLEEELKDHRTRLVANLRRKYGLDSGENHGGTKLTRKEQSKDDDEDDLDAVEIPMDEEWVPNNKKRKVVTLNSTRSKSYCCSVCKMEFSDFNRFTAHVNKHKELKDSLSLSNEVRVESDTPKSFKCGCCTLSFDKKEALAIHMRLHTIDKQQNRSLTISGNQTVSTSDVQLLKNNLLSKLSNKTKPIPHTTAQTVVEMKLIMDTKSKTNSTVYTTNVQPSGLTPAKDILSKEQVTPVTITTENDSGGKVCLLALWNNGSCSDHPECQKSSGAPQNQLSGGVTNTQQRSLNMPSAEMYIPKMVVQQSQGVPQVVVSQSDFKLPEVVTHYQVDSSMVQQTGMSIVPNVPLTESRFISIPNAITAETNNSPRVHISASTSAGGTQSIPQVVVSLPNSSTGAYNTPNQQPCETSSQLLLPPKPPSFVPIGNQEPTVSHEGDGTPSSLFPMTQNLVHGSLGVCGGILNEQSSGSFPLSTQVPCEKLDALNSIGTDRMNGTSLMPHSDKSMGVVNPITTERTIVEQDEMGNIAIVNVTSVQGSETAYSNDDVTDWFFNHQQSNAIIPAKKASSLWINEAERKSGLSGIDQIDGMQSCNTLPLEVKEQNDSVDEEESSNFFTSRYTVDSEKLRKEAEALADALLAVIGS